MKVLIILAFTIAASTAGVISPVPVTTLTRVPSLDSAVIKSDRLGGNFAYSVQEAHAYEAKTPIIQQVATPVAVSYSAGHPIQYAQYAPAYATQAHVAVPAVVKAPAAVATADHATYTSAPVYTSGPVYASGPIIIQSPDGKFTELKLTH